MSRRGKKRILRRKKMRQFKKMKREIVFMRKKCSKLEASLKEDIRRQKILLDNLQQATREMDELKELSNPLNYKL